MASTLLEENPTEGETKSAGQPVERTWILRNTIDYHDPAETM